MMGVLRVDTRKSAKHRIFAVEHATIDYAWTNNIDNVARYGGN